MIINSVIAGTNTNDATASTGDILSGKTAYAVGEKLTGTMLNNGAVSQAITTQNGSYTVPAGYHSGSGIVTANFSNLVAENIKTGVNVGGVLGNLEAFTSVGWTSPTYHAVSGAGTLTLTKQPRIIILSSYMAHNQKVWGAGTFFVSGSTVTRTSSGYINGNITGYNSTTKILSYAATYKTIGSEDGDITFNNMPTCIYIFYETA